jgi:hypothetical protein
VLHNEGGPVQWLNKIINSGQDKEKKEEIRGVTNSVVDDLKREE